MIKPIVTNIKELKKQCEIVKPEEDISIIITDLKDTLIANGRGLALAAPQIGIQKQICYIRLPKGVDQKTKSIIYSNIIAINPVVIEKDKRVIFKDEGCLSLPGLRITTDRFVYCTIQFENEKRKLQIFTTQDIESFIWMHEIDHLKGILILDRKHKKI
jgi:peptide deformylase